MNHETEIQKRIMVGISDLAAVFRSPAGLFWQGDKIYDPVQQEVLINIRPVKVLVKGYPDLTDIAGLMAGTLRLRLKRNRADQRRSNGILSNRSESPEGWPE